MAVNENDPGVPTVNVALGALVKLGASFTVSVNGCVASGEIPFVAVIVML